MRSSDLETLLDYHYWARDRLLDATAALTPDQFVQDMGSSFRSVRDTVVHLYSAEWAWYQRWQGLSPAAHLPVEQFPDLATLRDTWTAHEAKMRAFLAGLGDEGTATVVDYRTFNGQPGRSAYWQMLLHLVNHGSYHRGQVTTMLRQLAAPPPKSMDLIGFFRERDARTAARS